MTAMDQDYSDPQQRTRCYLDIESDNEEYGRVVLELYNEICPITCENFRSLCTGENGKSLVSSQPLCYRGCRFHRVIKAFMIQTGDFTARDGTGGESVYGQYFNDENLSMKHDRSFLLSMANRGSNTNGSQFFITTSAAHHLDGKHVVFGEVISGFAVVNRIEQADVKENFRPVEDISIVACGELVLHYDTFDRPQKKALFESQKESSELNSKDEIQTERQRLVSKFQRAKKKYKLLGKSEEDILEKEKLKKVADVIKRKLRKLESLLTDKEVGLNITNNDINYDNENDELTIVGLGQGEDIFSYSGREEGETSNSEGDRENTANKQKQRQPSHSWLYRHSRTPSPLRAEGRHLATGSKLASLFNKDVPLPDRTGMVSSSGRILKGRGTMKYRTPPPDYDLHISERKERISFKTDNSLFRSENRRRSISPYRVTNRRERGDNARDRRRFHSPREERSSFRNRQDNGSRRFRSRSRSRDFDRNRDKFRIRSRSKSRERKNRRSPRVSNDYKSNKQTSRHSPTHKRRPHDTHSVISPNCMEIDSKPIIQNLIVSNEVSVA